MYFQTLDDKTECVGIYANQRLIFDVELFPEDMKTTWSYSPYLRDLDIEYALLYLEGTNVWEYIPEYLRDDWEDATNKMVSFKRSLVISKVDTTQNCFFDLVPDRFLIEFCEVKNKVTEYIINAVPKPKRYEFYKHVSMMLGDIESRDIKLDYRLVRSLGKNQKLKNQATKILSSKPFIKYKQFGTKTGRLSTAKNTFPILTLNKAFRQAVLPTNDFFIELDFNGAEVRTLLGLLGKDQPDQDVHDFHAKEIFETNEGRDVAKVSFFAWLYGSRSAATTSAAKKLAMFYKKEELLGKYWRNGTVTTPYGKVMDDVDSHHALNYLVQSTAAELMLKQALKIDYLLRHRSKASFICFLIHDAVVIDMKKEDAHLIKDMVDLMRSTNFGKFGVNFKKGKTLGSLSEVK